MEKCNYYKLSSSELPLVLHSLYYSKNNLTLSQNTLESNSETARALVGKHCIFKFISKTMDVRQKQYKCHSISIGSLV